MAASMWINNFPTFHSKMFFTRLNFPPYLMANYRSFVSSCRCFAEPSTASVPTSIESETEEFRVYEIRGLKKEEKTEKKKLKRKPVQPPRYLQMPVDQDWTKVWPAAASFKYSVVPFPVRQGFIKRSNENEGVIPAKYANAELMKIPNFLHLTPAHVKKHCAALQKFCTKWPQELDKDNLSDHFPVSVTNYNHCFSGSSLRHPKARVVKTKFKLDKLGLDYHGRDKFIRLVGDRYDEKTGVVTIEADRCPVRIQNYEYIMYLITALYYESKKIEPWESEKEESDWERIYWDKSKSRENLLKILRYNEQADASTQLLKNMKLDDSDETIVNLPVIQNYKKAVCELVDDGEDSVTIEQYKNSVLDTFGLKKYT